MRPKPHHVPVVVLSLLAILTLGVQLTTQIEGCTPQQQVAAVDAVPQIEQAVCSVVDAIDPNEPEWVTLACEYIDSKTCDAGVCARKTFTMKLRKAPPDAGE